MANLYGVANPIPYLQYVNLIGGTNLLCPAGVETNIFQTGALSAFDHGIYYIVAWVNLTVGVGGTAPTQLNLGLRINNGADLVVYQVVEPALVPSTFPIIVWFPVGYPPANAFWAPGSNIQVSANPTGTAVTMNFYSSQAMLGIFRAPDA